MYDLDTFRTILRQFGVFGTAPDIFSADGVILTPIGGVPGSEAVPGHVDRLVDVGLLRVTNDIHMKHHPDPPTLRVTEEGRIWVRRAYDDAAWNESSAELRALTDGPGD
jgi:hypothetical protein